MAASGDMAGLRAAWRALAGGREREGWKTIPINVDAPCMLLAGRRLPSDEEAVLVGFQSIKTIPDRLLPQGHGFQVSRLPSDPTGGDRLWIALTRRMTGSLELFTMMAEDLVSLVDKSEALDEDGLLHRLLSRIRAWQDFMDRYRDAVLSPEAELGLFGELVLMDCMIQAGMPARNVIESWQGPLDGLQDFMLGNGGIEVKTTLSASGFPATVSSLEQFDSSLREPLFLAAVRVCLDSTGMTLPAMAETLKHRLQGDQAALDTFERRLVQAGLVGTAAEHYSRRFSPVSIAVLPILNDFPRLTRAHVHPAIRKARYEIDVDLIGVADVSLSGALELLGAI